MRAGAGLRAAMAAAVLAMAGLAMPGTATAKTVRWSASGDPNTLDPHSQNVGTVTMVLQQIYDPLIKRNPDLSIAPGLATEWRQEEPTRWRFLLRPGVRFHEGEAMTAEDVAFSIQRALQPTSNFGIFVDTIDRAVVVDERTVDIVLKRPDPILPNKLASIFIMSKAWSERHNATRPQNTRAREEMHTVRNANGTGAFRLAAREPDVRTTMTRNEAWWGWGIEGNSGNVTEIVFRPIASDATRIAALLSGEVDFVLDPPLQDLNRLRQAPGVKVLEGPEVRTLFLAFDVNRDELLYSDVKGKNPFKDLRVRQALYQAIDIQAIHRTTMRGQSVVTGTLFPEQVNGYVKAEDVRLPFDANRARALLAEAGYPQGFAVTLDCSNNRYINDEQICQNIAAMWSRVGVRTSVKAQPLAPFFAQIQRDDTSVYMLGWGVPTLDALYSFQSLVATRNGDQGDGIWNYGRYSNPRMDALIQRMKAETGEARQAAITEALRLYREDVPHIPLHHQMIPWAMRSNIQIPHLANNQPYFRWAVVQ
ncbi:ABC transporter substrate-binding protein [Paracraurococcus ruber]|uniref:ABC transporter substrate-binding protein n=2 Tax=Paracraurococcus ruber TaxID=77675 RepID=A0ABS1CUX0_9PROT|nr:ABC transporter substrate-binding protein [Paracraurococcus ruber]MBK1658168.1 ABC transporter substrate-binding protein [Paracraurococcus ruber]TDG31829.1 ABC transporter substrate-binding protein [Paracraurococcus ruber]